ncbi:alpha/beta hydrolase [Simiduia sp. 21SJ11W-1]|uniref:alpha/beta fold hydrolase n=1 Tax=Simiduia sp. 21SJ11W-1 TaxID=2909669 RepID=UPI00209F1BBA|nr:alpha/beta hydrolase [Simiduia sp. 21SJ11W-1]UTA48250.1 alpha/beta hydrolase [Simiduia sp. 21SJ11W-1]
MSELSTAITAIHTQWQPLSGSAQCEKPWRESAAFQTYLQFYGLTRLQARFQNLRHGFGYLNVSAQKIAAHYWLPSAPKGVLLVLHGYYDHVGLYGNAIEFGLQQGFAVVAFDLPGHGLSEGPRASIDDFSQYTAALAAVVNLAAELPVDGPTFALAQSTGCSVLLKYQLDMHAQVEHADILDGQILLAPLVRPHGWHISRFAHFFLRHFIKHLPRVFTHNSHDEAFLEFLKRDPLQPTQLSVRWVSAMKMWLHQFWRCKPLTLPTLIIQGREDTTVDWRFNIPVLTARLPNHQLHWLTHARHQLINERSDIRAEYLTVAAQFLESLRVKAKAKSERLASKAG